MRASYIALTRACGCEHVGVIEYRTEAEHQAIWRRLRTTACTACRDSREERAAA